MIIKFSETNKIRVDMMIGTNVSDNFPHITKIVPNGKLYDMEDNEISLSGSGYAVSGALMCYAIIDATTQVPSSNINVGVEIEGDVPFYSSIGYPASAESVTIEHDGSDPLAPRIWASNVRFNPELLNVPVANPYIVGNIIAYLNNALGTNLGSASTSGNMQINVSDGSSYSIKHPVVSASNVYFNSNYNLQQIINMFYEELLE